MKKCIFIIGALIVLSFEGFSQKVHKDAILGLWDSYLDKGHVEIIKEGDVYRGKLVWLHTPNYPDGSPKSDKHNPDPSKQKDSLIGLYVLNNMVFVNDHWESGTIYDPESGKTYSCRIIIKGDELEMRGYIGISEIGRTQTWNRIK